MIVFGHNNFKVKTFTARDLRLPQEPGINDIEFQVRQRYAHLFWIPFFPIGKLYAIKKKGDSNLYEMPDAIKHQIKMKHKVDARWENEFYVNQAEHKMMVKYPTSGDYYKFNVSECDDADKYNYTDVILKVTDYDDNTIEFSSAYLDMLGKDQMFYSMRAAMNASKDFKYNTFTVQKEDLLKLFDREYNTSSSDLQHIEDLGWCFKFQDMERADLD